MAAGARELIAIPLAPQFSTLSVGEVPGRGRGGGAARRLRALRASPGTIIPGCRRLRGEAARGRAPRPEDAVLFTAHSLPVRLIESGDPYAAEVAATAAAVARRGGHRAYERAYQSAGRTPEPWLGPSARGGAARAARARRAVACSRCPIGFVCDHTEILFDIDVQAAREAARLGLALRRTESLNTSPTLIRALADLVRGLS